MWIEDELFWERPPIKIPHTAKYICSIDCHSSIVMRYKKAVKLGYLQFAIFRALHESAPPGRSPDKKMLGSELYDRLYRGAKNPPGRNCIAAMCSQMNHKLAHVGLKIQGTNRRQNSYFQIVML